MTRRSPRILETVDHAQCDAAPLPTAIVGTLCLFRMLTICRMPWPSMHESKMRLTVAHASGISAYSLSTTRSQEGHRAVIAVPPFLWHCLCSAAFFFFSFHALPTRYALVA